MYAVSLPVEPVTLVYEGNLRMSGKMALVPPYEIIGVNSFLLAPAVIAIISAISLLKPLKSERREREETVRDPTANNACFQGSAGHLSGH